MPRGKGKRKKSTNGRKTSWFRDWCDKTLREPTNMHLVRDVLNGKDVDDIIVDGQKMAIKPKSKERIDLLLRLSEYAYGKPVQQTQMLDSDGNAVAPAVILMPQSKGKAGEVK